MTYPHRIRLRGPWQATPLSRADGDLRPPATTVRMPCRLDDVWPEFRGTVRLTRPFGLPRQLDDYERVWLTVAGMTGRADAALNGQPLGHWDAAPFEVEVTGLLRERNELVVRLHVTEPGSGLWGEVALEIRCRAWLRGVTIAMRAGALHLAGETVGHADRPLDLYAILGRTTVIQAIVTPTEAGAPFSLKSDLLPPQAAGESAVRVELVSGAVAWHTQDFAAPFFPDERPACPS